MPDDAGSEEDAVGLDARLRRLEDELAIRNLLAAWQRVSDDAARSFHGGPPRDAGTAPDPTDSWHADGTWTGRALGPSFTGADRVPMRTAPGRAAAVRAPRPEWMPSMMHFLSNVEIDVTTPYSARGRCYSWEAATVVTGGTDRAVWIAGTYEFEFVREDDRWKFLTSEFTEVFSTPFDGPGWVHEPAVDYGPAQAVSGRRGDGVAP